MSESTPFVSVLEADRCGASVVGGGGLGLMSQQMGKVLVLLQQYCPNWRSLQE